jgi:hypothetical protein
MKFQTKKLSSFYLLDMNFSYFFLRKNSRMPDKYSKILRISVIFFILLITNQVLFIEALSTKKLTSTKNSKILTTTLQITTSTIKPITCSYGSTLDGNSCKGLLKINE